MLTIFSGGQTGIDRMALDVAIELGIAHGGWCPLGRRAEDGKIPGCYRLTETDSRNYKIRTRENIVNSDGTLIFYSEVISGGTELTARLSRQSEKPLLMIDAEQLESNLFPADQRCLDWLFSCKILCLNVAGPRQSSAPKLPDRIYPLFKSVLQQYSASLANAKR